MSIANLMPPSAIESDKPFRSYEQSKFMIENARLGFEFIGGGGGDSSSNRDHITNRV